MDKLALSTALVLGASCAFAGIKVPCNPGAAAIVSGPGVAEQEFVEDAAQFLREVQWQTSGDWESSKRPTI